MTHEEKAREIIKMVHEATKLSSKTSCFNLESQIASALASAEKKGYEKGLEDGYKKEEPERIDIDDDFEPLEDISIDYEEAGKLHKRLEELKKKYGVEKPAKKCEKDRKKG